MLRKLGTLGKLGMSRSGSGIITPNSLFSNGEQGVWYDPSNIRTGTSEYAVHDGTTTNYFYTPDSEASSVTGDITVFWTGKLESVNPSDVRMLVSKADVPSSQYSYSLFQQVNTGQLTFTTTGDGSTFRGANSTVSLASVGITANTRVWLYVQRVASTGITKFFYSFNGTTYTQLGADVSTTAGNIFNSTEPLTVGIRYIGGLYPFTGKTYGAKVFAGIGIDGTPVVDFDPTRYVAGNSTFTASTGEVWTLTNNARIESDDSQYSMYQDSTGTTPVNKVEQPVGLVLDKSKGFVLGPELVVNGDFSSSDGWTIRDGWTIANGVANATNTSSYLFRNNSELTVNTLYRLTYTISNYVSGSVRSGMGSLLALSEGIVRSANGTYTEYIRRTTDDDEEDYIGFKGTGFTGSIDNFSIREISENYAYQSTSTKRPVLSARVNMLTYTEDFSNGFGQEEE